MSVRCCWLYLHDLLFGQLQLVWFVGPQQLGLRLPLLLQHRLSVLPALPRFHPLVKRPLQGANTHTLHGIFLFIVATNYAFHSAPHPHGSQQADVICDDFGKAEGVVGCLVLVQLLHLVLHLGQLREGSGQSRVVLRAAQHGRALGEAGCI